MRSGRKLPAASIFPPNLPATYGRLAATILIQATALSSKRCRHYLRHIRNAINQKDGKGTKRYVRSELQEHRTTTDTPCRFQRGTQITIIQNRVAYIPTE